MVGSGLTHKNQFRLERLARVKHSSLLRKSVNCSRKKFYRIGPWNHFGAGACNIGTTTSSIMTLSIMDLNMTLRTPFVAVKSVLMHSVMLSVVVLSVIR